MNRIKLVLFIEYRVVLFIEYRVVLFIEYRVVLFKMVQASFARGPADVGMTYFIQSIPLLYTYQGLRHNGGCDISLGRGWLGRTTSGITMAYAKRMCWI